MNKVCILGLGYIGLPTAAILASCGKEVVGADINFFLLDMLQKGQVLIEEPGLEPLVYNSIKNGHIKLSHEPENADAFIIAVPTPCNNDKTCNLSYVVQAVESIVPHLKRGNLVILESTVPPGTCENYVRPVLEKAGFIIGEDLFLAFCPERVLPGQILRELVENDRIIGGCTPVCASRAAQIYAAFITGKLVLTDLRTAEMVKLVENTYRDVNIALANEITMICNYLEINPLEVIRLANKHPRVNILQPGPGVGGHCVAVDPYFIVEQAPSLARLIDTARTVNNNMPGYVIDKVKLLLEGIKQPKIAAFGLSYKGNVFDLRESPAVAIIEGLIAEGFQVCAFDPHSQQEPLTDMQAAVEGAHMILILTDHDIFKSLNYMELSGKMRTPIIFDTRDIVDFKELSSNTISFYNLGNIFNKKSEA